MKNLKTLSKKLMPVVALIIISLPFGRNALAFGPLAGGTYTFQSDKLAIKLEVPDTWKSRIVSEETANAVVFKYSNPGGQPVFLFSINKTTDAQWIAIKDEISNSGLLIHTGSTIYYFEKTDATRIKGTNNDEYKTIVSNTN